MRMAAEAIKDTERIYLDRQRLGNVHDDAGGNSRSKLPGVDLLKKSLDVKDKHLWDPESQENFSVFAQNPLNDLISRGRDAPNSN